MRSYRDETLDRTLGDHSHPLSPYQPEITDAQAAAERAAVERLPGWKLLDILQNSDSLKVRAEFDAWLVPLIRAAILRGDRDLPLCEAAVFEAVAEEALNER